MLDADRPDIARIFRTRVRIFFVELTAVRVRERNLVNKRRGAGSTTPIEFVGADFDKRSRIRVIPGVKDDDVIPVRVRPREPKGQFVRFASGADEVADTQRSG